VANRALKIAIALSIVLTPPAASLREGDMGDMGDLRAPQVRQEREMCRSVAFRAARRTLVE